MANLRLWHSYLAVLIAPSLLFFALTGALQLFNLHEAHGGYEPPALIEKLSRVHKDQVFASRHRRGPPPGATAPAAVAPGAIAPAAVAPGVPGAAMAHAAPAPGNAAGHEERATPVATLLLKFFFLLVALGLATSTVLGVWIAFLRARGRRLVWTLLIAGTVVPLALLVV